MIEHVLITGGAGFIGSHAAVYYSAKGVDVTIVDSRSREQMIANEPGRANTTKHNWQYLSDSCPDIALVEADVRDADRMVDLVDGHDAIIHTAGQVAVTESLRNPRRDFDINTRGTLNILEAARAASTNPAVVFASTNKVYGENVNEIPVKEADTRYQFDSPQYADGIPESFPVDNTKHTPYGTSKLAADLYIQDYAQRGIVDAATFRMSCIYGPRQFGTEEQGWLAHFILSAIRDNQITVYGDGKQVRDVLFVDDLIRAYDAFLSDPAGKPSVYNIGGGPNRSVSLLEVLERLSDIEGREIDVTFEDWRQGDQRVYITDTARANETLDWSPRVDLETGIERFIEWYTNTYGRIA